MPELPIARDFTQVKYAFRIRRLTRLRFELECVWIRFKTEWYGQWTLLERLGAVNRDGSIAWMTECTLDGTVSWEPPAPGTVYEVQAPAGEVDGHETGGRRV